MRISSYLLILRRPPKAAVSKDEGRSATPIHRLALITLTVGCLAVAVNGAFAQETDERQQRIERIQRALKPPPALIAGRRQIGSGTGFAVSAAGHVLTNHHVVGHCGAVSVTPPDRPGREAERLASDPASDLALLKAALPETSVAAFRAAPLPRSAELAVVGYPSLGRVAIRPILVAGRLYDGRGAPTGERFAIVIDVHKGNSGGPVFDRAGAIAGIVVARANAAIVLQKTGEDVGNLGLAIGIPAARRFLAANGVAPALAARAGPALGDADLLERGRAIVVQVGCWQ